MAVREQAAPKRGIIITAIVALVSILIGGVFPPLAVLWLKLLPNDADIHYRLSADAATVIDVQALLDDDSPAPDAPRIQGEGAIERYTTTAPAEKFMETNVNSEVNVTVAGDPLLTFSDFQRLNRDSAFPVLDPVATQSLTLPTVGATVEEPEHTSEGLRYFFPFETERRSYQFSDEIVPDTVPLDYVNPTERSGLRAYEFHSKLPVTDLFKALAQDASGDDAEQVYSQSTSELAQDLFGLDAQSADNLEASLTGPAEDFYTAEEMERFDYAAGQIVTTTPYYYAERTYFIEPKSGVVLGEHNTVHVFLAANNPQASEIAETASWNQARTLFTGDFGMDEATKQAQLETAKPVVTQLRVLQVVTLVANLLTFVSIAVLVLLIVRYRRANH